MYDPQREVALEAIRSAGRLGGDDYIFVPPLVSLLRNRLLKASARQVLVGYGEGVVDTLAYFLRDPDEDIWVRRHIPSTLAQIPSQKTMDVLVDALGEADGFLRFKVINALLRLKQSHPQFALPADRVQPLLVQESNRYFSYLSLHYNLVHKDPAAKETLVARALDREAGRTVDRLYRLLGLLYPWKDISAARWSLEHGDARVKASAAEYLDNLLDSQVRKRVMPVLEDLPIEEKVRRGNLLLKTRVRDAEDSLAQLVHDEDQDRGRRRDALRRTARPVGQPRRRPRVRARASRPEGLVRVRGRLVGAGRPAPDRRAAPEALARAAAGGGDGRSAGAAAAVQDHDHRRAVPHRRHRPAGAARAGPHHLRGGPAGRRAAVPARRTGHARAGRRGRHSSAPPKRSWDRRRFGFDEVFEGVPQKATVKASGIAICLSLLNEQFLGLLSENTELAQGVFRMLLDTHGGTAWGQVLRDVAHPSPARRACATACRRSRRCWCSRRCRSSRAPPPTSSRRWPASRAR